MTTAVLRKELHTMIDTLPVKSLPAIKPLLFFLVNDYWKPVVEYANQKEADMIEDRMKDYNTDPSSFIKLI